MGKWVVVRGKVKGDDTTKRIEWLTSTMLEEIGPSKEFGGWYILYRDRSDGRYWELTYPQGHMHGGGPPKLSLISEEEAGRRYNLGGG